MWQFGKCSLNKRNGNKTKIFTRKSRPREESDITPRFQMFDVAEGQKEESSSGGAMLTVSVFLVFKTR